MKLYKYIFENKFFLKMMLTYCLIIFLGLGLTSYFVTFEMIGILTEKESIVDNEVIQRVKYYSEDRFKDITNIFARLYTPQYFNDNASVVDFINDAKSNQIKSRSKLAVISSYLQDTCSANSFITDIFIVDYHASMVFFFSNESSRDVSINYDFFRPDFLNRSGVNNAIGFIPNYIPDYISSSSVNNFPVISYYLYLFDQNSIKFDNPLGMVVINLKADFFKTAYKDFENFKGEIFVIDKHFETLFDSSGGYTNKEFPFSLYSASGFSDLVSNEKYIVNKLYSLKTGLTFVDIVDREIIAKETDGIRKSINNIIAVCVALTLTISLISASLLSKRIKSIVKNMKDVESGKLDTRITVTSNDEIGYLERSFNSMCMKLEEYIKNVYIFEIKTKSAELKALQAQINPHFLFNTLETIRITAQINNDVQAAKMIHILGNMFRWNIKMKGMFVDLKEEIDYVQSYIELQRLRHDNSFDVSINVESSAWKLGVPKLILQPLVENAINHGLSGESADAKIEIWGTLYIGKLILLVCDNGKGMDEETVQSVVNRFNKSQDEAGLHNIGLSNVHQRVSILFGEDYGLKIYSELGTGTRIELSIPAKTKEEMERHVQSDDS